MQPIRETTSRRPAQRCCMGVIRRTALGGTTQAGRRSAAGLFVPWPAADTAPPQRASRSPIRRHEACGRHRGLDVGTTASKFWGHGFLQHWPSQALPS